MKINIPYADYIFSLPNEELMLIAVKFVNNNLDCDLEALKMAIAKHASA